MEEIYRLTRNKRIIVRKKIANFLEKVFRYCGYDFDHDVFKKVIYSEDAYKTPVEAKIKNYYDAYTVSFWHGCFVESQGRSSVLFLVLHGFGANIYVNNGLERRVPEMLEQPCAFDEQILNPYISSSLLLEVSQT